MLQSKDSKHCLEDLRHPGLLGAGVLAGLLLGTGGAIALAGQGISSAGDGLEKMAAGVERMAAVKDTANLANVAESIRCFR